MNKPTSFLKADIGREMSFGKWFLTEEVVDGGNYPINQLNPNSCSSSEFLPGLHAAHFSRHLHRDVKRQIFLEIQNP